MKERILKIGSLMLGSVLIAGAAMARPMNVLFIVIDDLRPEVASATASRRCTRPTSTGWLPRE